MLSDENKLKIILSLIERETCVCELVEKLKIEQSLLSHHLINLKKEKVVKSKKEGRKVLYSINLNWFKKFEESLKILNIKT